MTAPLGIRMAAFSAALRAKAGTLWLDDAAQLAARAARELDGRDPIRAGIEDLHVLLKDRADRALRLDAADRLLIEIDKANMPAVPGQDRVDIHG